MDDERALLARLHELLSASAAQFGETVAPIDEFAINPDFEVYRAGPSGVVAFFGDYCLGAWPDEEMRAASREAYRILHQRLRERGMTRHMVNPRNFRSVKLTRKLGAKPVGYDADGYMHYTLTLQAFEERRHG